MLTIKYNMHMCTTNLNVFYCERLYVNNNFLIFK